MEFFRCQCKKIICQIDTDTVIIKCRHCKRYIHIKTKGIEEIKYSLTSDIDKGQSQVAHTGKIK
jgi:sensor histidine kinase YesM